MARCRNNPRRPLLAGAVPHTIDSSIPPSISRTGRCVSPQARRDGGGDPYSTTRSNPTRPRLVRRPGFSPHLHTSSNLNGALRPAKAGQTRRAVEAIPGGPSPLLCSFGRRHPHASTTIEDVGWPKGVAPRDPGQLVRGARPPRSSRRGLPEISPGARGPWGHRCQGPGKVRRSEGWGTGERARRHRVWQPQVRGGPPGLPPRHLTPDIDRDGVLFGLEIWAATARARAGPVVHSRHRLGLGLAGIEDYRGR